MTVNKGEQPYFLWYCHSKTLLMSKNSPRWSWPRNLTHRKWAWRFKIKTSTEIQEMCPYVSVGTCAAYKLVFLWKRRQFYVLLLAANIGLLSPDGSFQLKSIFSPIPQVLLSCNPHVTMLSSHCFIQNIVYWFVPEQGKEGTQNRLCDSSSNQ